ncbi:MAG: leucine-rich repeat protein [Oscillospiraceae bacterium]|nr:leucine-rich repeat protein [Oscillospiraceae bacterium]
MDKKRILGVVSAGLLLAESLSPSGISLTANAESEVTDGDLTYMIYDTHATVRQCDTAATEVTVLSEIDGYPVTVIENNAFEECTSLISVTIPEGVTTIGAGAFYSCTSLQEVNLPDSITAMGIVYNDEEATQSQLVKARTGIFYNCKSLKTITLPKNLESIKASAFYGCSALESVRISESVKAIGNTTVSGIEKTVPALAFSGCVRLNQIEADENNQYYTTADNILYNKDKSELCLLPKDKESYTFPETVTSVSEQAASGCNKLKSIAIPERVTQIGEKAFGYSSSGNPIAEFTVYGVSGSAAETYALENGFIFAELGSVPAADPQETEFPVGDHNQDGRVDASDAACILMYAAEVGAGNFSGTLPEFMENLTSASSGKIYNDGIYTVTKFGYDSDVTIVVTIKNDVITDITASCNESDMYYFDTAYPILKNSILVAQSPDVDAVSGATFSSDAIRDGVREALNQAKK